MAIMAITFKVLLTARTRSARLALTSSNTLLQVVYFDILSYIHTVYVSPKQLHYFLFALQKCSILLYCNTLIYKRSGSTFSPYVQR